jgi:hypothetical protein
MKARSLSWAAVVAVFMLPTAGAQGQKVSAANNSQLQLRADGGNPVKISSTVPQVINYQGYLTDASGNPANDTFPMIFGIYDVPTGGTALWDEEHTTVMVTNGVFNVLLGSSESIPLDLFDSGTERYLEVTIEGTALTPRRRFGSVPYAFHTRETGGGGNTLDQAYDQGGSGAGRTITADAGAVNIEGPNGLTVSGNVGIGTTDPQAPFHVLGPGIPTFRLQSSDGFGPARIEFWSDPQNSLNEWRPTYIESTDDGGFTGGLAFFTNGTGFDNKTGSIEAMRITNGKVGIGTTSPTAKLHIGGAPGADGIRFPDGTLQTTAAKDDGGLKLPFAGSISSIGPVFSISNTGDGPAGEFFIESTTNNAPVLYVVHQGEGKAGFFTIDKIGNTSPTLYARHGGAGNAGFFEINKTSNSSPALYAVTNGTGPAGDFQIQNSDNLGPALKVSTNSNITTGNPAACAFYASASAECRAGLFETTNSSNRYPTLEGRSNSDGEAVLGYAKGNGRAGYFFIEKADNSSSALYAITNGTGSAGVFDRNRTFALPSLAAPVFLVRNGGNGGNAGDFRIENSSNNANALRAETDGGGNAIFAKTTGDGNAGDFRIENSNSNSVAVYIKTNGKDAALRAEHTSSTGYAADFTGKTRTKVLEITGGADLAEPFQMAGSEPIPEGAVVVIDDENPGKLKLSDHPYDKRVAGIVSGAGGIKPGLTLSQEGLIEGGQNVAISGRVYALADASNGPINPGDLLTTSNIPGHAMKATDKDHWHGAIIGKAMSSLEKGQGLVLVLVNLQ